MSILLHNRRTVLPITPAYGYLVAFDPQSDAAPNSKLRGGLHPLSHVENPLTLALMVRIPDNAGPTVIEIDDLLLVGTRLC